MTQLPFDELRGTEPIMTTSASADLRQTLNQAFDDVALSALCLDYFPRVYDRFSRGMRKDEKIGLLLDECRRHPTGFETLTEHVRKEYSGEATSGKTRTLQREELKPLLDALSVIRPWAIVHPYPALPDFTGRREEQTLLSSALPSARNQVWGIGRNAFSLRLLMGWRGKKGEAAVGLQS